MYIFFFSSFFTWYFCFIWFIFTWFFYTFYLILHNFLTCFFYFYIIFFNTFTFILLRKRKLVRRKYSENLCAFCMNISSSYFLRWIMQLCLFFNSLKTCIVSIFGSLFIWYFFTIPSHINKMFSLNAFLYFKLLFV